MGQHTFELFVVQDIQNSLSHGDCCVLRIASRSEGVRRIRWDHVDLGHGQPGLLRQSLDYVIDARELFTGHWDSPIHRQGNLVGEKIRTKIHHDGKDEGIHHAASSAQKLAYSDRQERHQCQQKRSLERVHVRLDATGARKIRERKSLAGTGKALPAIRKRPLIKNFPYAASYSERLPVSLLKSVSAVTAAIASPCARK